MFRGVVEDPSEYEPEVLGDCRHEVALFPSALRRLFSGLLVRRVHGRSTEQRRAGAAQRLVARATTRELHTNMRSRRAVWPASPLWVLFPPDMSKWWFRGQVGFPLLETSAAAVLTVALDLAREPGRSPRRRPRQNDHTYAASAGAQRGQGREYLCELLHERWIGSRRLEEIGRWSTSRCDHARCAPREERSGVF